MVAEAAAVDRLLALVLGDPFLFQLAGQHAWEAGTGPVITAADVDRGWRAASAEARRHVSRMLERVPDGELAVLEAMASLDADDRSARNVARALGHASSARIGTPSRRLEDVRGLIVRGRDRYRFTHRSVEAYLRGGWP